MSPIAVPKRKYKSSDKVSEWYIIITKAVLASSPIASDLNNIFLNSAALLAKSLKSPFLALRKPIRNMPMMVGQKKIKLVKKESAYSSRRIKIILPKAPVE